MRARVRGNRRSIGNAKIAKIRKLKFRATVIIMCALIIAMCYFLLSNMKPLIQTISANQARLLCTSTINKTIVEQLEIIGTDYDKLVHIINDDNGMIVAIESNTIEVNRIKTQLTDAVNDALKKIPDQKIGISIGTLSGIELLSGRGPKINMIVTPSSYVESELVNRFDSAGINQTRHQIVIDFKVSMFAILAPFTTHVEVRSSIVIAETIIVGGVPDTYANF